MRKSEIVFSPSNYRFLSRGNARIYKILAVGWDGRRISEWTQAR
jgi:hypothetical protein